jgi:hypothetical protein
MLKRTWRPTLAFNALLAFALWALLALVLWVWGANPAAAQAHPSRPVIDVIQIPPAGGGASPIGDDLGPCSERRPHSAADCDPRYLRLAELTTPRPLHTG